MTRTKHMLLFAATAVVSAAVTVLALAIFEDEPSVAGALQVSIRSAVLGEGRKYYVHLPEGYEPGTSRRYPVLYVLDGTSQSEHTAESASLMARVGLIPPMIVVGVPSIDGDTRNRDYTPPDMRLDTDDAGSQNGAADPSLESELQYQGDPLLESATFHAGGTLYDVQSGAFMRRFSLRRFVCGTMRGS